MSGAVHTFWWLSGKGGPPTTISDSPPSWTSSMRTHPSSRSLRGDNLQKPLNHGLLLGLHHQIRARCDFGGFATCHSGSGVRAEQKDTSQDDHKHRSSQKRQDHFSQLSIIWSKSPRCLQDCYRILAKPKPGTLGPSGDEASAPLTFCRNEIDA